MCTVVTFQILAADLRLGDRPLVLDITRSASGSGIVKGGRYSSIRRDQLRLDPVVLNSVYGIQIEQASVIGFP